MHSHEILAPLQSLIAGTHNDTHEPAEALLNMCVRFAENPDHYSPYAQRADEEGFFSSGGKCDDITIVVAKVGKSGSPEV